MARRASFVLKESIEERIDVAWDFGHSDAHVTIGGAEVCAVATATELRAGRAFTTPHGVELVVRLADRRLWPRVVVERNGRPLPDPSSVNPWTIRAKASAALTASVASIPFGPAWALAGLLGGIRTYQQLAAHDGGRGTSIAAIVIGGLRLAAYGLVALVGTNAIAFLTNAPRPVVTIVNPRTTSRAVWLDGVARRSIPADDFARIELEPGAHRLCIADVDPPDRLCAERVFAKGDAFVWNPRAEGRFVHETLVYSVRNPGFEVTSIARAEWHDVAAFDHVLEEAPVSIVMRGRSRRESRFGSGWASPASIYVLHGSTSPRSVSVDGHAVEIAPGEFRWLELREGDHAITGGPIATFRAVDYGTYILDLDGDARLARCRPGAASGEPIAPAVLHDVSASSAVFGEATGSYAVLDQPVSDWIVEVGASCARPEAIAED